ncbi:MAG: CcoQ/FixQ family Cbb3-type cytochrome c oxidase assembly chaperone [Bacteroidetes bacterium]|nr:MAG: CcoQ/FixQ family Cbb3-type cytochrome c oxidase assembly chaperone [Bacteroidota bacterium]
MFKNYLKGIDGIADYPMLSLIAFFLFFIVMSIWLYKADKNQMNELAHLPFKDEKENKQIIE